MSTETQESSGFSKFTNKVVETSKLTGSKIAFQMTRPTTKYIYKRILSGLFTLFLIATVVFFLIRMLPRDGFIDMELAANLRATGNRLGVGNQLYYNYRASIYRLHGFDRPLIVQLLTFYRQIIPIPSTVYTSFYVDGMTGQLVGQDPQRVFVFLGTSTVLFPGETTSGVLATHFPISLLIGFTATVLTYLISYPLGILMAKNKGKLVDSLGNGLIIINLAVPALVFFFILWRLFLIVGMGGIFTLNNPATWMPPILALTFVLIPSNMMWVRRFMVDEGDADYVKFARSKGLSENKIMFTHVFRNALVPLIRNLPMAFVSALMGSFFIEMIWSIPGSGALLVRTLATDTPDIALAQGIIIFQSAMTILAFIIGDVLTAAADPRVKLEK